MNLLPFVILATLGEAYRNYLLIKRGKDPHNWGTYLGRLAGIIIMVTVIPGNWEYFWTNLIGSLFIFWFLFDYSLNLLRGKELLYLSDKGVDALQKKYPGAFPWFVWKAILALAGGSIILQPELL